MRLRAGPARFSTPCARTRPSVREGSAADLDSTAASARDVPCRVGCRRAGNESAPGKRGWCAPEETYEIALPGLRRSKSSRLETRAAGPPVQDHDFLGRAARVVGDRVPDIERPADADRRVDDADTRSTCIGLPSRGDDGRSERDALSGQPVCDLVRAGIDAWTERICTSVATARHADEHPGAVRAATFEWST